MSGSVLQRHQGIRFAAVGRIELTSGGRQRELLAKLCGSLGGELAALTRETRYLVVGKGGRTRAVEAWNAQGASIELVRQDELPRLFALRRDELLELVREGSAGLEALRSILRALKDNLQLPSLEGADLQGVDLSGLVLHGVNLTDADLSGTDLSGSRILGSQETVLPGERVRLDGANLRGALIERARLDGASFRGANLCGASLRETSLQHVDFSGARLEGAQVDGDLSQACLVGASLPGTTLSRRTKLDGAALRHLDLSDTTLCFSLANVDLRGATLSLQDPVNLRGANLGNARFVRSRLDAADLRDTQVEGTDFGDCSMICTRFGPPQGGGQAGPAFLRLQELWRGRNATTTITVRVGRRHTAELKLASWRHWEGEDNLRASWRLVGPDHTAEGHSLDPEDLTRWFGGEGTADLTSIRCDISRSDRLGLRKTELRQLLRDTWSELLGIESLDGEQIQAQRSARRAELDQSGKPSILRQLAANPDDDELWFVYADWLQDQGDPRGEIIAQEMRLPQSANAHETHQAPARLAAPHLQLILGDLAHAEGCSFDFHRAHVHTIHLFTGRQAPKLCRELARHPATRFARRLVSRTAASGVMKPLLALVGARPIVDLTLQGTGIQDVAPIAAHTKLRALDLGYTKVTNFLPLASLVHLEAMYLVHTPVEDLSMLGEMSHLRVLNLVETRVKTLSPIAGKPIERLYLSGWHLTDFETLLTLDSLQHLRAPRHLPPKLRAELLEKLPDLEIQVGN